MKTATLDGETVLLFTDPPNWDFPVQLRLSVPVDRERGLTGRERRRPMGETLRCVMSWSAVLSASELNSMRDMLAANGDAIVVVPAWPFASSVTRFNPAVHVGGGLWVIWSTSADHSIATSPGSGPLCCPALVGRLTAELPELVTTQYAQVRFTFTEDSEADYALEPPTQTWDTGPALPDATVPNVFPFAVDWSNNPHATAPLYEFERRAVGPGRVKLTSYYTQIAQRGVDGRVTMQSVEDVARFLRWWYDCGATAASHYVGTLQEVATLTSDASTGAAGFVVSDGAALGSFDLVELHKPGAREIVRVDSVVGDSVGIDGTLAADWTEAETVVSLAALVRNTDEQTEITFLEPGLAHATLTWKEVPDEDNLASGETRGSTIGRDTLTAYLYKFTLDNHGDQTDSYFTSYERDLSASSQTWTTHPIEHKEMRQAIKLDKDELTLTCRRLDELEDFIPGRLENRVLLTIYSCSVSGSTGSSVAQLWTGEITSVSWDGPQATITARGPYALFDRPVPRWTIRKQCNHTLFDAGCGLSFSYWTFGATVVSGSTNTVTLDTFTFGDTFPAGWGFEDYYALGFVARSSGEKISIIKSTAESAGEITLTLDRTPKTSWGASEVITLVPGCDGTKATCLAYDAVLFPRGKFFNYARFGGFPWLPAKNPTSAPVKTSGASYGKK